MKLTLALLIAALALHFRGVAEAKPTSPENAPKTLTLPLHHGAVALPSDDGRQQPLPVTVKGVGSFVYTVAVRVGTQLFNLTLDTQAQDPHLFAKGFTSDPQSPASCNVGHSARTLYDSSLSKTFQRNGGDLSGEGLYRYPYIGIACRDSTRWSEDLQGTWAADAYSFGSFSVPKFPFILANHTQYPLNPDWPSDGILPLADGGYKAVQRILMTVGGKQQVTLWLRQPQELNGKSEPGGQITFGGVDTTNCGSKWTMIQSAESDTWATTIANVKIGQKLITSYSSTFYVQIQVASPLLEVPSDAFKHVIGAMNAEYDFELDKYTVDCGKVDSLPEISATLGRGFELSFSVKPSDFIAKIPTSSGPKCTLLIVENGNDQWAIGTQFLPKRCVLLDYYNQRLSFADPVEKN